MIGTIDNSCLHSFPTWYGERLFKRLTTTSVTTFLPKKSACSRVSYLTEAYLIIISVCKDSANGTKRDLGNCKGFTCRHRVVNKDSSKRHYVNGSCV